MTASAAFQNPYRPSKSISTVFVLEFLQGNHASFSHNNALQ
jgi:hypothetical protein